MSQLSCRRTRRGLFGMSWPARLLSLTLQLVVRPYEAAPSDHGVFEVVMKQADPCVPRLIVLCAHTAGYVEIQTEDP